MRLRRAGRRRCRSPGASDRSSGSTLPRHGESLWEALSGHDDYGPICPTGRWPTAPPFWVGWKSAGARGSVLLCRGHGSRRAVGLQTLVAIRPDMRTVEVGHIVLSPALQRTPLATRRSISWRATSSETLGYRRYEWKCNALKAASLPCGAPFRLRLRGRFPQAHDRQGPQPRQRLVAMIDTDWPPAGRLRALARAR